MMMMPRTTRTMSSVSEGSTSTGSAQTPRTYRHEPYALNLIDARAVPVATLLCHARRSPRVLVSVAACRVAPVTCPAPPAPLLIAPHTPVYVCFKYGRRRYQAPFPLEAHQPVVVEGDRGVDLGVVEGPAPPGAPCAERVLRAVTARDAAMDAQRGAKEQEALAVLRELAAQVECPARLEDVMLQLDGRKVTAIISRDTRAFIDFRRLQRAAFDVFRCRVWFSYLDEIEETMRTDVTRPLRRCAPARRGRGAGACPRASPADAAAVSAAA